MVAVTDTSPDATSAADAVDGDGAAPVRNVGVVPTASLLTGAAIATVWFWVPLTILIIGSFDPHHRLRVGRRGVRLSDARRTRRTPAQRGGFRPRHRRSARRLSPYTGFQSWLNQLWLDISGVRFWKATAHHYLRMAYDMLTAGMALALLACVPGPGGGDRDPAERRRRRAGVHVACAGVPDSRYRGGRRRGDSGFRACCRRRHRPLAAVAVADGRAAVPGQRNSPMPGKGPCRRRRPSVTASSATCTTACSAAGFAGDDDRPGPDEARHGPARGQAVDRRGARRRRRALVELRNVVRGIAPTILVRSWTGCGVGSGAAVGRSDHAECLSATPTTRRGGVRRVLRRGRGADEYRQTCERRAGGGRRAARRSRQPAARHGVRRRAGRSSDHQRRECHRPARAGRTCAPRGTFTVSSPVTGPTIVTAVLPCAS